MRSRSSGSSFRRSDGDRFTDDLFCLITGEPLGARVPTGDNSVKISVIIASSDASTIAAWCCRAASPRLRLLMSRRYAVKIGSPPSSDVVMASSMKDIRAITPQCGNLDALSNYWSYPGFQVASETLPMSVAHPFWDNEVGQFVPNRFSARETENVLGREVELMRPVGVIHRDVAIVLRTMTRTITRLEHI